MRLADSVAIHQQQPPPQYPPQQPYYPPQQPYYQPPQYPQQREGRITSVGEWFLIILVLSIPLVNLIMLLVWAFSNDGHESRANFCKAALIWMLIGIGLAIIWVVIMAAVVGGSMGY